MLILFLFGEKKLETTQNQIIQTDYKLNQVEVMCRKEPFSQKLDTANTKLDSMRQQDDTLTVPKIKKLSHESADHSAKLGTALEKLDSLAVTTSQLQPDIDRIKLIEVSVDVAEKKLDKALNEAKKLDETLERLEKLNAKMAGLEPELNKIKEIESTLEKFDTKQSNLISILMDAINRKKPTNSAADPTPGSASVPDPTPAPIAEPLSAAAPEPSTKPVQRPRSERDIDKMIDTFLEINKPSTSRDSGEAATVAPKEKSGEKDSSMTMRERIRVYEERRLEEKAKREAIKKEKKEEKEEKEANLDGDGKGTSWASMVKKK
jgi:hypothetical protein